jgi:hypothetical protein
MRPNQTPPVSTPISSPSVPKPPEKQRIKDQRSFIRLIDKREYLLDGVEEYDDDGNLVEPWREGNIYVLVKPLNHEHYKIYFKNHGESIDKTIALILGYEFLLYKNYMDTDNAKPLEKDEHGGFIIPEVGVLYEDFNIAKTNLCAFLLSCHGKIVGKNPATGEFILNQITEEEISKLLPGNFANLIVGEAEAQETVFYELLRVTAVFNSDILEKELVKDQELKEDELKNSSPTKEITKSDKKPSKVEQEIVE